MDVTIVAARPGAQTAAKPAAPRAGISFHDVLSALNPLQYLPVVGTIYRAITGDTVAEPLRTMGSLAVSGLTGGPIGMLLNLGSTALQKVTGIDPDRITHDVLTYLGVIGPDPAPGATQVAKVWTYPAPATTNTAITDAPATAIVEAGSATDPTASRAPGMPGPTPAATRIADGVPSAVALAAYGWAAMDHGKPRTTLTA